MGSEAPPTSRKTHPPGRSAMELLNGALPKEACLTDAASTNVHPIHSSDWKAFGVPNFFGVFPDHCITREDRVHPLTLASTSQHLQAIVPLSALCCLPQPFLCLWICVTQGNKSHSFTGVFIHTVCARHQGPVNLNLKCPHDSCVESMVPTIARFRDGASKKCSDPVRLTSSAN